MQLYCTPHYPEIESYVIAVILHQLNYTVTLSPEENFDAAILWDDQTFVQAPDHLFEIAKSKPVLNLNCVDISKRRVEQAMIKIFDRPSLVDPLTFQGKCIKKPDGNSIRHGFVVDCPVSSAEEDWVFQKVIETRVNGFQVEYRTPIILGEIPLVYVSQRDYPTSDIRDCKRHLLTPTATEDIFSPQEVEGIIAFSQEIGMDIGELDIMRSIDDGCIYIIDANKTSAGFGLLNKANWCLSERNKVVEILAQNFEKNLKLLIRNYAL